MPVKNFENRSNIWQRYEQVCGLFFRPPCIYMQATKAAVHLAPSISFGPHCTDQVENLKLLPVVTSSTDGSLVRYCDSNVMMRDAG